MRPNNLLAEVHRNGKLQIVNIGGLLHYEVNLGKCLKSFNVTYVL